MGWMVTPKAHQSNDVKNVGALKKCMPPSSSEKAKLRLQTEMDQKAP